ncbi:MAG: sulfite exporter TauE/SafE family protein [Chlamydiia bacterium]|nr:sulfite exporter TauE/SafE family protein [Chlamydiia bacterium]
MSVLAALLPLYLVGNIHCFGMCGPLVMTIAHHRYRHLYFLGRITSFTFAGWLSGSLGFVLGAFLSHYKLGAYLTIALGGILTLIGLSYFIPTPKLKWVWFQKKLARFNHTLSFLMLKDRPLSTFLFGFFTLFLPCGQTLIVFSALALAGSGPMGALNGFLFALLTSPSLFFAMKLTSFFKGYKKLSDQIVGLTALFVGILAILRGFAELDYLEHFSLSEAWHLMLW